MMTAMESLRRVTLLAPSTTARADSLRLDDFHRLAADLRVEARDLGVAPAVEAEAGVVLDRLGVAGEAGVEDLLARELPRVGEMLELGARDVRPAGGDPAVALLQVLEAPLREAVAEDPLLRGDLAHRVVVVDQTQQRLADVGDGVFTIDLLDHGDLLVADRGGGESVPCVDAGSRCKRTTGDSGGGLPRDRPRRRMNAPGVPAIGQPCPPRLRDYSRRRNGIASRSIAPGRKVTSTGSTGS
jgi:hypothetical protein